jgi:hypothetical protein
VEGWGITMDEEYAAVLFEVMVSSGIDPRKVKE